MIPCPVCGSAVDSRGTNCAVCEARLVPAMEVGRPAKCARCGSPLAVGQHACGRCGLARERRFRRRGTHELGQWSAAEETVYERGEEPEPLFAAPPPSPGGQAEVATADSMELVSVKADGGDGASWTIWPGSVLTVGAKKGQLRFPNDRFVSDPHARCRRLGDRLEVADMNSRNGIYTRIKEPVHVYPGDMFLMGHHLLRLSNLPTDAPSRGPGEAEWFGTPASPAWGRLVLVGGRGVESNIYDLRDKSVIIGREDCHIAFPDDRFMSRRHAKVDLRTSSGAIGVFLEDLGSANGTYLRVRNQVTLAEGDMLRIGDQLLRFARTPS